MLSLKKKNGMSKRMARNIRNAGGLQEYKDAAKVRRQERAAIKKEKHKTAKIGRSGSDKKTKSSKATTKK